MDEGKLKAFLRKWLCPAEMAIPEFEKELDEIFYSNIFNSGRKR